MKSNFKLLIEPIIKLQSKTVRISFDPEVEAMYIRFHETTVTTKHPGEGIAADFDADGNLAGIEILDILKRQGRKDIFKQVILEDVALAQ